MSTIIQRYHRLGLSPRRGTDLQKALLNRGLIVSSPIAIGHARIKVLSLTELGKVVLGINETETDRFGGPEHRYWKHRLTEHLRIRGYTVELEVPIGGGKTIDLVAARDGQRIALEIETGKSDAAANVRKCLDAGMAKVVVVATSATVYARLLVLQRYKSSRNVMRRVDNLLQDNKLISFSGGYRHGRQDNYEHQTDVEPISATV